VLDDNGWQGKQFVTFCSQGNPLSFVIAIDRVMQGWNEGVIGTRRGGRHLLRPPPSPGYGSRGVGDVIPPQSSLILIIELPDLEKHPLERPVSGTV
jgi:FKBP-type peptidyl-prolyl cis-trans isomerase